jgi:uncharacterized protein (TIGR02996 family)
MARNKELEAKLIEDPTNVDIHMVYADFLQSNGDPRGELIMLQNAGKTKEAEALLEKHADQFYGDVLPIYSKTIDGSGTDAYEWRLGFIRKAIFSYDSNCEDDIEVEYDDDVKIKLENAIEALLTHPSGALIEEIVIPINMLDDGAYFGPCVEAIAKHGSPSLRRLRIGQFECAGGPGGEGDYEYEISWTSLGDASGLWKALPRLEKLVIQSGLGGSSAESTEDKLGKIDAPRLKHLEIITGGLSKECAKSVANAKLPSLTRLDLWFGSDNYGGDATLEDIEPIFDGENLPKLERLGLMNSGFADDICNRIGTAKILPRLKELSLAYGTMSDDGAKALSSKAALSHLKELDVNENYLTSEGQKTLEGVCPKVVSDSMRTSDGDGDRYVALSE